MLIIGAGGHAKEVLSVVLESVLREDVVLFDDVSIENPPHLYGEFLVLNSFEAAKTLLNKMPHFCIAVGAPADREFLFEKFHSCGGVARTVIASSAIVGSFDVVIGEGVNVMHQAFVSNSVTVGDCCLLNRACGIHHDCTIGKFCTIGPGAILLGRVILEDGISVGAGAIILPGLRVGNKAVVGAGAVVTKDVAPGVVVVGAPAKAQF